MGKEQVANRSLTSIKKNGNVVLSNSYKYIFFDHLKPISLLPIIFNNKIPNFSSNLSPTLNRKIVDINKTS